jgi:hypothetical protein
MNDTAYLREHAERYRHLARAYNDHVICKKLAALAQECDDRVRELRQRAGLRHAVRPTSLSDPDRLGCQIGGRSR